MCTQSPVHHSGNPVQVHRPEIDNPSYQWVIMPVYGTLPSFALFNAYAGKCIANNPDPEIGTVTTTNDVNNFQSQWLFYHLVDGAEHDPDYALLNKVSGTVLEYYQDTRIEAHDTSHSGRHQTWRLLPLRERSFALVNADNHQLLCDPGVHDLTTDNHPEDIRALSWHLVSHRESGFDFVSLDFDILQRLLPYLFSRSAQELRQVIEHRLPAGENKKKGKEKYTYIPHATRITRATNDELRVILTRLIGQWGDDSISGASQPVTIVSADRRKVEQEWGISLSERALRRRSEEPEWIRIDLKGMSNIDGNWVADIQGQWLEVPVFQIIIPAGICVDRTVIQRAMLQSLTEGLTVEVRATPPAHTPTSGKGGRLGMTARYPDSEASDGSKNSLTHMLNLITIESLKHDEL